ncbi:uncharacterized protein RAG0_05479 [Rhynchosporium agropyri]|uniref:DNA/RNA-binding protein Alba-like domain-containing protein n=1 Tax=Rhynchosporium agropyri TaxID=914238 RepID=A0A1E1KGW5_9HELO|nr:uncharacterized protein RAG0_05479 [Rhynchosporium agropyri]
MSRTTPQARRGPEGHAFRENAAKRKAGSQLQSEPGAGSGALNRDGIEDGAAVAKGSGKRKRKRNPQKEGAGDEIGAKRRKNTDDGQHEGGDSFIVGGEREGKIPIEQDENLSADAPVPAKKPSNDDGSHPLLIPIFPGLESTYTVTTMSIISSSNIGKKVCRILDILSLSQTTDQNGGTEKGKAKEGRGMGKGKNVLMLYAKAPVACKLISVAEIAKRQIAKEGGKWFEYCCVGEVVTPITKPEKEKPKEKKKVDVEDRDQEGGKNREGSEEDEEDEAEAFEVMKTPFERALESEGRQKIRALPVMSLYLSRGRISSLRTVYGEQTNAQEVK